MRRLVLIIVLAFATAAPSIASAEEPTAADRKKAKKLILAASRAKRTGDKYAKKKSKKYQKKAQAQYKKAALAFIEAHVLIEHPAIVYKLAEVYRARGEYKWARRGFVRYRELEPHTAEAEKAARIIEKLEAKIADIEASGESFPEDDDTELDPTAVFGFEKKKEPEPPPVEEEPEEPEEPEPEDEEPDNEVAVVVAPSAAGNGKLLRYSGMGAGGLGGVFLVLGIKFGIDARSAASDLEANDDQWNQNDKNRIVDGKAANDKFVLFTSLGLVTAAAGGALYYLGWRTDNKEKRRNQLTVTPSVGDGHAGLMVWGRF